MKWWSKRAERPPSFWTPTWTLTFLSVGVMLAVGSVDAALMMPYVFNFHYVPEAVGFFLLGMACWEGGLRKIYFALLGGWTLFFVILSVVALSLWALPPVIAFALICMAGFTHSMRRDGK